MEKISEKGTKHSAETTVEQKGVDSNARFELSVDDGDANALQNKITSNSESADAAAERRGSSKSVVRVRSACPICGSDKLIHSCHAVQEDESKGCVPKSCEPLKSLPVPTEFSLSVMLEAGAENSAASDEECKASYIVIHLGSAVVDRRFPPKSIMPWVMAEVKRSRDTFKEVSLNVLSHTLKAVAYDDSSSKSVRTVFEHKLNSVSRFAKTHQDPRCFGYLRRESLYSDYECHVFLAHDEKVVSISLL